MTSLRRTASLLVVLAMLLTMTAIPAFAVASGSATITAGSNLLSGQSSVVTVRIANTSGQAAAGVTVGGSPINAFVIEVPAQVVDVTSDFALPAGWNGGYDDEIGFIFAEAEGSGLAAGQSLLVNIPVNADRIADDRKGRFVTSVSDNKGVTLSEAGAPEVTSRILEVLGSQLVKPAEATNTNATQVTAEQNTAKYQVTVKNYGSAARTVEANVVRTGGSSDSLGTTPGSKSIAAGAQETIDVAATFGTAGTLSAQATAKSTTSSSTAQVFTLPAATVQAKFAANLVNSSLDPTSVAQGTTTTVTYKINKTAGAQPVSGSASLEIAKDSNKINVTAPQSFDAANGNKTVAFENVAIPSSFPNGDYSTTSTITGVDGNGATVSLTVTPGIIKLDDLLPIVTIQMDPGPSDVPGTSPATTNGRTITFSGTIKLNNGPGKTPGDLCPDTDCKITKAVLLAGGQELQVNLTNNGGVLSGQQSFTFPANTLTTVAKVTVRRTKTGAQNLSTNGTSNIVDVDLIKPKLFNPGVTGRETANDVIIVPLLDDGRLLDAEVSTRADWFVDNNAVVDVIGVPAENGADAVKLLLQNRLGDNDTPTVTYRPVLSPRMHDRVSLTVADQVIDTVDGIIPAAPVITKVAGLNRQPDAFFTNKSTPTITLSSLVVGNTIEVFYDLDGNGELTSNEKKLTQQIESSTETFTLGNLGSTGRTANLVARMRDGAGNIGLNTTDKLTLDFTTPQITGFTVSGNDVTVLFDEVLSARGRNGAFDWTITATDSTGRTASRTVTTVANGTDLKNRVLTVSGNSWDGSGSVDGVRYKFRGAEAERYDDRATNTFPDTSFNKL